MARKGGAPPLYELIRRRRPEGPEPVRAPPEPEQPTSLRWLSPGRTVRLPVGYLLLGSAVTLALVVAAFTAGYVRGGSDTKAEHDGDWLATASPLPPPEVVPREAQPPVVRKPQGAGPAGRDAEPAADWGPVLSDPRQEGLNYFVLMHTQRDSAVKLAEFCRDQGVEAYAVKAKNLSLYQVVALPGYGKGERFAEFVRGLEQRLDEIRRKWKVQVNPRDDLEYYPEKFTGP